MKVKLFSTSTQSLRGDDVRPSQTTFHFRSYTMRLSSKWLALVLVLAGCATTSRTEERQAELARYKAEQGATPAAVPDAGM